MFIIYQIMTISSLQYIPDSPYLQTHNKFQSYIQQLPLIQISKFWRIFILNPSQFTYFFNVLFVLLILLIVIFNKSHLKLFYLGK